MSYKVLARISAAATLLVLAACQTTTGGSNDGGKWKNIGASANQNVTHEIDTASIKRNGDMVSYRTRMVLKNAGLESTPNLPAFKTGGPLRRSITVFLSVSSTKKGHGISATTFPQYSVFSRMSKLNTM